MGEEGDRDIRFIDRVVKSLRNEGWVDDARVFATGHSNGGGFTYALWNARPGMLAAAAPVAAGSVDAFRLTPLPCMHVAARGDGAASRAPCSPAICLWLRCRPRRAAGASSRVAMQPLQPGADENCVAAAGTL